MKAAGIAAGTRRSKTSFYVRARGRREASTVRTWKGTGEMPNVTNLFSKFAANTSTLAGRPATFVLAVALVIIWAVSGPIFNYSEVWQLVINTSTTIITFLMIFLLQNSQNRDSHALQAKLDALILSSTAHDRFVGVENLDEEELDKLIKTLEAQAKTVKNEKAERSDAVSNAEG